MDIATGTAGFEAVYAGDRDRLRRLAYLLTGRQDVAEDLVQEAFVRLHRRWAVVESPAGYVRTVLTRLCADWRRRAALADTRERWLASGPTVAAAELDETWAVLGRLPADQRAVLVLRFYEDLSVLDTAAALGCRPATVRTRTHRALARLRKEMTP
jgi:RNA polymerase sigma-70 factor (sigma-E family)